MELGTDRLFEIGDDFADFGDFAFLLQNLRDGSRFGRGQFDGGLFAFESDDRFILLDDFALLFEPVADFDFGDGFADFGDF